jgi:adenylate cyclase class IV
MPRNVEIKAAVPDFGPLVAAMGRLVSAPPAELWQEDTFFRCPAGRLKLRKLSATSGELIYYERGDDAGPRESHHVCAPTSEPDLLRETLAAALETLGVVRKRRTVYMLGRTRVHLDEVDGLGKFVELEVVLAEGEPAAVGIREVRDLMVALSIRDDQLVSQAYVDLLPPSGGRRSVQAGFAAPP